MFEHIYIHMQSATATATAHNPAAPRTQQLTHQRRRAHAQHTNQRRVSAFVRSRTSCGLHVCPHAVFIGRHVAVAACRRMQCAWHPAYGSTRVTTPLVTVQCVWHPAFDSTLRVMLARVMLARLMLTRVMLTVDTHRPVISVTDTPPSSPSRAAEEPVNHTLHHRSPYWHPHSNYTLSLPVLISLYNYLIILIRLMTAKLRMFAWGITAVSFRRYT